jgi:hypothetical protein
MNLMKPVAPGQLAWKLLNIERTEMIGRPSTTELARRINVLNQQVETVIAYLIELERIQATGVNKDVVIREARQRLGSPENGDQDHVRLTASTLCERPIAK